MSGLFTSTVLLWIGLSVVYSSEAATRCQIVSPFEGRTTDAWIAASLKNISVWRSLVLKSDHERQRAALKAHGNDLEVARAWLDELATYQIYGAFTACPPPLSLTWYGPKRTEATGYMDGGKWACGPLPADCIVYSLGSRNDYEFERSILEETTCKVWTFDCTVKGQSQHPSRHHFEKLCVSDGKHNRVHNDHRLRGLPFARLEDIMERLGHTELALLKMDIEGAEFDAVAGWLESDEHLPPQISVEVHKAFRYKNIDVFMQHMSTLGYGIINKDDNVHCPACSEITFLKVEQRICRES